MHCAFPASFLSKIPNTPKLPPIPGKKFTWAVLKLWDLSLYLWVIQTIHVQPADIPIDRVTSMFINYGDGLVFWFAWMNHLLCPMAFSYYMKCCRKYKAWAIRHALQVSSNFYRDCAVAYIRHTPYGIFYCDSLNCDPIWVKPAKPSHAVRGRGLFVFKGGYDARTRKHVKRVIFFSNGRCMRAHVKGCQKQQNLEKWVRFSTLEIVIRV